MDSRALARLAAFRRDACADGSAGADAVDALLDHGATFTAAEMLGSASRVLEMATDYAKERVQFGRPIGSFQAVKHRCADMLVDVEGMRSTVYWAAWCIGAGDPDASIAASTAKTWCSDASKRVMASGLQVHGGIGFTWEHDLHFFLKRAQLDQLAFGDATYHRERLTALVRPRVEAERALSEPRVTTEPGPETEWNDWGPPVRVRIDAAPVMILARTLDDTNPVYASEAAALEAGFPSVPVLPDVHVRDVALRRLPRPANRTRGNRISLRGARWSSGNNRYECRTRRREARMRMRQ